MKGAARCVGVRAPASGCSLDQHAISHATQVGPVGYDRAWSTAACLGAGKPDLDLKVVAAPALVLTHRVQRALQLCHDAIRPSLRRGSASQPRIDPLPAQVDKVPVVALRRRAARGRRIPVRALSRAARDGLRASARRRKGGLSAAFSRFGSSCPTGSRSRRGGSAARARRRPVWTSGWVSPLPTTEIAVAGTPLRTSASLTVFARRSDSAML